MDTLLYVVILPSIIGFSIGYFGTKIYFLFTDSRH